MKTIKINYKVIGHKQAKKDMDVVTEAAKRLEDAIAKLSRRVVTVQFKSTRSSVKAK